MQLIPNEHFAAVSFREAADYAGAMLPNSLRQVRGNPDIQRTVSTARHDIDYGLLHECFCIVIVAASRRHCEKRSDEAIQASPQRWIASLSLAMTVLRHCFFAALAMTALDALAACDTHPKILNLLAAAGERDFQFEFVGAVEIRRGTIKSAEGRHVDRQALLDVGRLERGALD